jgi:beta-fructofuranosidase
MLRLHDDWVWDIWIVDDGSEFHLFFLKAPRSLGNPDQRHWNTRVGHAVSSDLSAWEVVEDAIWPSSELAFDDRATWTGSVVRDPDGLWRMFYTGAGSQENGLKQRIGMATSTDLFTWHKHRAAACEADPRWYERLPSVQWHDEAWRDPWVFRDPSGNGWHMLVTARAADGAGDNRGVIGYAHSRNLDEWQVGRPITDPCAGFGHLEVPQVEIVDGRPVLVFSCLGSELAGDRPGEGGIWLAEGESLLGPFDIARARRLSDESLYAARIIRDRSDRWVLLAFRNTDEAGRFVGEIVDPIPLSRTEDGALELSHLAEQAPRADEQS